MDISQLKIDWKAKFDEAVGYIESVLTEHPDDGHDEIGFRTLGQWMLSSGESPYDYMPLGYQDFLSNPFATEYTLSTLHHALCDNGDVSFVSLRLKDKTLRHFILFADRNDDWFPHACQEECDEIIRSQLDNQQRAKNAFKEISVETNNEHWNFTKEDFNFVAHRNPVQFVQELQTFLQQREEHRAEMHQRMAAFRAGR